MFAIVAAFYTYTGILGYNIFILDIGTFFLGVAVSYIFSYRYLIANQSSCSAFSETVSLAVILVTAVAFAVFTFYPPELGLFIPPEIG